MVVPRIVMFLAGSNFRFTVADVFMPENSSKVADPNLSFEAILFQDQNF